MGKVCGVCGVCIGLLVSFVVVAYCLAGAVTVVSIIGAQRTALKEVLYAQSEFELENANAQFRNGLVLMKMDPFANRIVDSLLEKHHDVSLALSEEETLQEIRETWKEFYLSGGCGWPQTLQYGIGLLLSSISVVIFLLLAFHYANRIANEPCHFGV
jgi:hypothetical protein